MCTKNLIKRVFCFSVLALVIAGVSSCKKVTGEDTAAVQVVNASPDAGAINFYLSGNLKTTSPVTFGNTSGYFSTTAGNQTAEVKSSTSAATLASTGANLSGKGNYSVFVCGLSTTNSVNAILVSDELSSPSSGKAKVRFVNTVAASPNVNLVSNSTTLFSSVAYKTASSFMEIAPGAYTLNAVSTALTTLTVATVNQTFESGKIYTIYFKGAIPSLSSATQLSLGVITNK